MTLPEFETLELSLAEHVLTVCLNRPDKANSMNAPMWDEIQRCFEWADAEPEVRAVVLAGNGKHFCAGIDLDMFSGTVASSGDPARRAEAFRRKALQMQGSDAICICFLGDAANNQGTFHESLNMAKLWNLPVLYVCENNL